MKKLSLKLDTLSVQSFETLPTPSGRGTVQARGSETDLLSCGGSCGYTNCEDWTCLGCPTNGQNTCANSCNCQTQDITCQASGFNPVGTCCGAEC
jgi:hypothetical protein